MSQITEPSTDSKNISIWHLYLLSAFAIAAPILDLLGRTPEFLVIRRTQSIDVIVLITLLLLSIPTLLSLLILIARRFSSSIGKLLFSLSMIGLIALIGLPGLKSIGHLPGVLLVLSSLALGLAALFVYYRFKPLGVFLNFLSPAFVVFPLFFIQKPTIRDILFPRDSYTTGTTTQSNTPLVMVIFDELPLISLLNGNADLDAARYPGFAELANTSNWFRNTTSVSSWTEHAVPIILSGKYPDPTKQEMPALKDYPQNLFTVFANSYKINAYEQVTHLCPDSICSADGRVPPFSERIVSLFSDVAIIYAHATLPKDLTSWLPDISFSWGDFIGGESPRKFKANSKGLLDKGDWADDAWLFHHFMDSIHNDDKPAINFIHITFPHVPYRYLPSGKKYLKNLDKRNDKGYKKEWGSEEWPTIQQYQRYLLQLGYADKLLSELWLKLKAEGIFDKSLIVVTADHGTSFQPKEFSRRISNQNFMDVMLVPFFMKLPGQTQALVSDRNVETIDILPTIAQVLGMTFNSPPDGQSALNTSATERESKTFYSLDGKKNVTFHFPAKIDYSKSLARYRSLFGDTSDSFWQYRIGPFPTLLGQSANKLNILKLPGFSAAIDSSADFDQVDLNADFVPAFISGEISLTSDNSAPIALAIILNGKIAGLTFSNKVEKSKAKFSSMLAEELFVQGKNQIEIVPINLSTQ